jgi:hypothetical protein
VTVSGLADAFERRLTPTHEIFVNDDPTAMPFSIPHTGCFGESVLTGRRRIATHVAHSLVEALSVSTTDLKHIIDGNPRSAQRIFSEVLKESTRKERLFFLALRFVLALSPPYSSMWAALRVQLAWRRFTRRTTPSVAFPALAASIIHEDPRSKRTSIVATAGDGLGTAADALTAREEAARMKAQRDEAQRELSELRSELDAVRAAKTAFAMGEAAPASASLQEAEKEVAGGRQIDSRGAYDGGPRSPRASLDARLADAPLERSGSIRERMTVFENK